MSIESPESGHSSRRRRATPEELTETDIAVYQYAVRHGHVDVRNVNHGLSVNQVNLAEACDNLLRLRLLSDESAIGLLTPVHPDTARMLLSERLVSEIKVREQIIDLNNRQLRRVADALAHPAAHSADIEGIRVVPEPTQVQREVDAESLRCSKELVTTYLGAQTHTHQLGKSVTASLAMLKRGVGLRMLYQHIARTNLGIRSQVTQIARHGGLASTTSESFDAMFIFDRRIAFVPFESSGDGPPGAAVITHPVMVHFLYRSFERLWSSAMPFEDTGEQDKASADNRILLLRLMASGLKDEAIAHRLGIATRTCRRHMSVVMEELGANSRIQAGVKIARLGILPSEQDATPRQPHHWADAHPLSYLPETLPLRRRRA